MKTVCEVLGLGTDSFTRKNGQTVTNHLLVLIDRAVPALTSTMDYIMSEEEKLKYGDGKLTGQRVEVGITDMNTSFNGRLRINKGSISQVNGK